MFISLVLHGMLFALLYFRNSDEKSAMTGGSPFLEVTLVTDLYQDSRLQTKVEPYSLKKRFAENAASSLLQQKLSHADKRHTNVHRAVVVEAGQVKNARVATISPPHILTQNTNQTATASLSESILPPAPVNNSRPVKQDYLAQLRAAINQQKYYPRRARRLGKEGNVLIQFLIYRDGRIDNVTIRESSGEPLLDRAARQAVLKLGIYQPFPDRLEDTSLSVAVAMRYVIDL